jgi:hypothetical protein
MLAGGHAVRHRTDAPPPWAHAERPNPSIETTMTRHSPYIRHLAMAAGALLCATASLAAGGAEGANARFQQDMALCNSGQSNQTLSVCRIEARAALAEARRGGLSSGDNQLQRNAQMRCEALEGSDRADCQGRMRGEGSSSGSVGSGGVIRSTVTTVPGG